VAVRDFEQLWDRHHRRVHAYALRRTDPASAQDVVSETFLVAWRRRAELPADELPWLLGVARLVLANHARTPPEPTDADHEVRRALAALNPDDREALILVGWDRLRPAEAALVVGCSPPVFRMRLFRARRRLAAELRREADLGTILIAETRVDR
jgi:RNA polymerase sigma-70 factor (ECF subfamily)